jgi:hypothetical protein
MMAALAVSCFAGAASGQATVSPTQRQPYEMFQRVGGTAALASRMRKPGEIYVYADEVVAEKPLIRDTTEQEHVIARIREWRSLQSNWDGEGALPPTIDSLNAASDFVCLLPPNLAVPEPMLHATGRTGLSWSDSDGSYGELEFLNDGNVAYFFTHANGKHKGSLTFDGHAIPAVIAALIQCENAT